jgi:ABC-2 type transport system permease protein
MSFSRVRAVLLQELYISKRSVEVVVDLPFFSVMSVIVFGFVSSYLGSAFNATAANYLFLGILLWEIIRVTQYSMSVEALWNVWSRNLSNMFITPMSLVEYLLAQMISGCVKALVIFGLISIMAAALFHFNVAVMGPANLLLFFLNLVFFAWSLGLAILGIIFRLGTRIQALAWGLIFLFQPITAAFFPLSVLPPAMQTLARAIPPTYIFEAARLSLDDPTVRWDLVGIAFLENVIYFAAAALFFSYMYRRAKQTGQFARNEE